jgi:integrase
VSSLLCELHLLDPGRFPQNLVHPLRTGSAKPDRRLSLYRRQPKRVPDVIPEETLRAFFAALPTWRDRTLVLLMWVSCLRVSEAVAVRFQDIECSHRRIDLRPSKGGHPRAVYREQYTFAALNRYLDSERRGFARDVDEVFVALKGAARGRPLSVNAVQQGIRYYAAKCGAPGLHAHLFRHTGITHLVQQGMAEPALRAFVGHRRPESLLPYLHLADRYVEDEFRRAEGAFEPVWLRELTVRGGMR